MLRAYAHVTTVIFKITVVTTVILTIIAVMIVTSVNRVWPLPTSLRTHRYNLMVTPKIVNDGRYVMVIVVIFYYG